jgi:type VI secretion system secreted protein Hcp
MALMAYMYAVGQKSGQIKGGVSQKGREDSVQVIGYSHEIVSPRDPHSGLPTGQRMHKPLVITKQLDKSTPLFYQVLCTNENLSSVTIKFWSAQIKSTSGVTTSVQHYTVKLTNASIAQIQAMSADDSHTETAKAGEKSGEDIEKISFTYNSIEWTWTDGGISANDSWESHV